MGIVKNGNFNQKKLLVVSRAPVVVKSNEYFYQPQDGKYIDNISRHFAKAKILCHVMTESEKWFHVFEGYTYKFSSSNIELVSLFEDKSLDRGILFNIWKSLKQYIQLRKLVRDADVVFVFMPSLRAAMGVYLAGKIRKRTVLYAGGGWPEHASLLYRWDKGLLKLFTPLLKPLYVTMCGYLERRTMRNCPLKIVSGSALIERYRKFPGVIIKTVPLTHLEKGDFYFREKVCEKKPLKIISVAPVIVHKGYEYLIEAIGILKEKNPDIPVELSIVGDFKGDKYDKKLRDLIKQYHLESNVKFMGYIGTKKEILQKYRESDIFILSSVLEGFPRVIWEAMTQGLPVIASRIPNIEYEFREYKDVILFAEPKNPDSIAAQVIKLVNDKELRDRIRKNAGRLVEDIFSKSPAQQFIDLLKQPEFTTMNND